MIKNHHTHNHYTGEIANKSWVKAYNKPNNGYARQLQWDMTKKAIPRKYIHKADQWIALTRHHAWPIISLIDEAVKSVQQNYIKNDRHDRHHHDRHQHHHHLKVAMWHCFQSVKASDEIYFPTAMALLGILKTVDEDDDDGDGTNKDIKNNTTITNKNAITDTDQTNNSTEEEIASKRVTYCDWSENAKNPACFMINKQQDSKFVELKKRISLARDEGCLFARKFTPGGYDEERKISVYEWAKIIHDMR